MGRCIPGHRLDTAELDSGRGPLHMDHVDDRWNGRNGYGILICALLEAASRNNGSEDTKRCPRFYLHRRRRLPPPTGSRVLRAGLRQPNEVPFSCSPGRQTVRQRIFHPGSTTRLSVYLDSQSDCAVQLCPAEAQGDYNLDRLPDFRRLSRHSIASSGLDGSLQKRRHAGGSRCMPPHDLRCEAENRVHCSEPIEAACQKRPQC